MYSASFFLRLGYSAIHKKSFFKMKDEKITKDTRIKIFQNAVVKWEGVSEGDGVWSGGQKGGNLSIAANKGNLST